MEISLTSHYLRLEPLFLFLFLGILSSSFILRLCYTDRLKLTVYFPDYGIKISLQRVISPAQYMYAMW